jgi:tRNA-dihydrouridine synthase
MAIFSKTEDTKPLPSEPVEEELKRPGTSGTEMLLTTNRRDAKEQFASHLRAENAYKAKKRSATARQHRIDAKTHFGESFSHFWAAIKSCGSMIVSLPWVFRGWKEERQERNEAKSAEKYEKQKAKLEAKMAKKEGGSVKVKDVEAEAGAA